MAEGDQEWYTNGFAFTVKIMSAAKVRISLNTSTRGMVHSEGVEGNACLMDK